MTSTFDEVTAAAEALDDLTYHLDRFTSAPRLADHLATASHRRKVAAADAPHLGILTSHHRDAHAGDLTQARDRLARAQAAAAGTPALTHTCLTGPACEPWYEPAAPRRYGSPESDGCDHDSCWDVTFGKCIACQAEGAAELAEFLELGRKVGAALDTGTCPGPDGSGSCGQPVSYSAQIAAPGYGTSYRCDAGHLWVKVGPNWSDQAPELTLADVI